MNISAIGSMTGASGSRGPQFDPAKMLDMMATRFIKKNDGDGDGKLSSQDLSGLSSDAFKTLDTDGDGALSSDEIKAAIQKAMDAMKQAMESGDSSAVDAVKNSAEGQLMELMRPKGHHHGHGGQVQSQDLSSGQGISQISISSIQITINQTIFSMGSGATGQDTGSGLNVTA